MWSGGCTSPRGVKLYVPWDYFQYSRIFVYPRAHCLQAALQNDLELIALTFMCVNAECTHTYRHIGAHMCTLKWCVCCSVHWHTSVTLCCFRLWASDSTKHFSVCVCVCVCVCVWILVCLCGWQDDSCSLWNYGYHHQGYGQKHGDCPAVVWFRLHYTAFI